MIADPTAAATKQDIGILMEQLGDMRIGVQSWKDELHTDMRLWKDQLHEDMLLWKDQLHEDMLLWKQEIKGHFDLVAENMFHDLRGAHKDDLENVKTRLTRVERKVFPSRS